MEPKEVLRLFVVRPPEPTATVQPDRLGPSSVVDKLSGLLEREKSDAIQAKLQELDETTKLPDSTFLLKLAEENIDLKAILALLKGKVRRKKGDEKASESSADAEGQQLTDKNPGEKDSSEAEHQKVDEKAPEKLSSDELRAELAKLRDRWVLDRILESRFATRLKEKASSQPEEAETGKVPDTLPRFVPRAAERADARSGEAERSKDGASEPRTEDDQHPGNERRFDRDTVERAIKLGTVLLLKAERPTMSSERLVSLLSNPIAPSMRLARALHLRKTSERHADLLPARQDKVSPLVTRRERLRTLRRVALDVLGESTIPEADSRVSGSGFLTRLVAGRGTGGGIFARLFAGRGNQKKTPARHAVDPDSVVKAMETRLDEEGRKELNAISKVADVAVATRLPSLFRVIEEEICGVTAQMAVQLPGRTGYAVSALTSAYARPQVPVQPLGFIELMRVTEELVDYSAREIAHIENKSGGETRERLHTYTETNQNILSSEQFEETEETRDLQTTQRNELASTSSQVAEQEFTVNAGLNVSATYGVGVGTSVQLDASLAVGYRSAVTTSQQTASTVSREVIAKTVSRIRQNQRRSQTATILRTTEERNRHEFTVAKSRTDTYLWVEKIEELKLKAYGKRLVLEFFVPEPGLPLALQYSDGGPLSEPEEFRFTPAQINEDNFGELKQKYGATGISAPPAEYLLAGAGHTRKMDSNSSGRYHANEESLKVPAGYIPYKIFVNAHVHGWADIFVAFAGREVYSETLDYWAVKQSVDATHVITPQIDIAEVDQQGDGLSLTVLFAGNQTTNWFWEGNVNVAVLCRRSCRTYEQWQLDTHDRLYAAYRARVAEFEERRLSSPMAGTVGGSAAANRQVELETVKKAATYILKGDPIYHDLYPTGDGGIPLQTFDIAGLQRLREELDFFEEAFEWRQSVFTLYPSFWGNEDRANERKRFHTGDPRHAGFLAAGAARVLLPVLPGREREVLEYLAKRFALAYADLSTDGSPPSAETIYAEIWAELPPEPDASQPDTWRKSLTDSREDLVYGQGTVSVTQASKNSRLNVAAAAFDPVLDLGREMWIEGRQFFVAKITDAAGQAFELDEPYSGPTNAAAQYLVGARTVGAPWRVSIPTSLVVLKEFKDQIAV